MLAYLTIPVAVHHELVERVILGDGDRRAARLGPVPQHR